jgi:hypothetical protein
VCFCFDELKMFGRKYSFGPRDGDYRSLFLYSSDSYI